jgi:hypothetical protein
MSKIFYLQFKIEEVIFYEIIQLMKKSKDITF